MSRTLDDKTVAITEHRYEKELTALIGRHGARIISCPLLEERPVENSDELRAFIRRLIGGGLDMIVFFTGVGARFLAEEADAMGESERFRDALKAVDVVARGPKPQAAMRKLGLGVDLAPQTPTSEGLLELLRSQPTRGRRVGVQLYGKPNPLFCSGLEELGAAVFTVQVYDYRPASDRERVNNFIGALLGGDVDVITFTSAPQVSALFSAAEDAGVSAELERRFNGRMAVAAIGEVTNRALVERGIEARIMPKTSKMGPLVEAIAAYFRGEAE